jgi:hypothetical protein
LEYISKEIEFSVKNKEKITMLHREILFSPIIFVKYKFFLVSANITRMMDLK